MKFTVTKTFDALSRPMISPLLYAANFSSSAFASFRSRVSGEPAVDRSEQFARLLHLALVAPEAGEAHGSAEFPGFGLLLMGDGRARSKCASAFAVSRFG
jgi:hypothetical protein